MFQSYNKELKIRCNLYLAVSLFRRQIRICRIVLLNYGYMQTHPLFCDPCAAGCRGGGGVRAWNRGRKGGRG
jgi:hypothetical protein